MSTLEKGNSIGEPPVELSRDEVASASKGKFREIHERKLANREPVKLTAEELSEAKAGKSGRILKKFHTGNSG